MKKFILYTISAFLFAGCANKNESTNLYSHNYVDFSTNNLTANNNTIFSTHPSLFSSIDNYLGTRKGGDCSGFITVLNNENNHIFFDNNELNKYFTNHRKSQAIYNYYNHKNLLAFKDPAVGDLIFFQNTLRSNKGKINNEISHVGVIREIYKDGRIRFVHNSQGKNKNDYMNLNNKNTHKAGKKIENSYIVRCGRDNVSCLASNRFAGFGKIRKKS